MPFPAIKNASVVATIYPSWSTCFSYYHTFAMTENFIIMIEQPLLMSVIKMTEAKLKGDRHFLAPFENIFLKNILC